MKLNLLVQRQVFAVDLAQSWMAFAYRKMEMNTTSLVQAMYHQYN